MYRSGATTTRIRSANPSKNSAKLPRKALLSLSLPLKKKGQSLFARVHGKKERREEFGKMLRAS